MSQTITFRADDDAERALGVFTANGPARRRGMARQTGVRRLLAAVIAFASIGCFAEPTSAKPPVDPSGQTMPTDDLPGWHQVFADDFGTDVPLGGFPSAVSSRWTGYDGFSDTHGTGLYAPRKVVTVSDGVMNIYVHTENGHHLVAALVPIIPGHRGAYDGLTYGRYAVRFRADPVAGYKTAWLLWPDPNPAHSGGDWENGEIDFPEGNLDGTINAFMHHRGNPRAQEAYHTDATYDSWHTAVIEWTPSSVKFYLDEIMVGNDTNTGYLPNTPMHWVLQTETAETPPTDSAAGNVQIDWVSIWSRK